MTMTFQTFLTCSVLYLEGTTSMSKCSQRRVECLLFDEGEDGRVLDYFDSYTKVNSLTIFQVEVEVQVQGSGSDSDSDYGRLVRKSPSLHGRKSTKFLCTAKAYFVCHIGPNFQISLICSPWF